MTSAATNFLFEKHLFDEPRGNVTFYKHHGINVVFILGKSGSDSEQRFIQHENLQNNDIIQGDFLDSYHKLTRKSVLLAQMVA